MKRLAASIKRDWFSAIKLAMKKANFQDIAAKLLIQINNQQQHAPSAAHQFDDTLYTFADNTRLQKSWEHLAGQLEIIHTIYASQLKTSEWSDLSLHYHLAIYKAIANNDVAFAITLTEEHRAKELQLLLACIK
ncbi:MAG: hypothetical protein H6Q74_1278 [Firmicutes bacterium]|nr:hypothetical protein [Bacillota bacterium]